MLVGYSRVSTQDQNLDLQKDALTGAGCEKIFEDVASGAKVSRAGLEDALAYMREGDTLVVWKLDRLGRSLKQLIEVVNQIHERKLLENPDQSVQDVCKVLGVSKATFYRYIKINEK